MPDISMCRHETCEMRTLCWRHEASGTEPTPQRQSYQAYEPDASGCRGFIERTRLERFAAETPERLQAHARRWLADPEVVAGIRGESIIDTQEPDHG